jgi:hypothetical protein
MKTRKRKYDFDNKRKRKRALTLRRYSTFYDFAKLPKDLRFHILVLFSKSLEYSRIGMARSVCKEWNEFFHCDLFYANARMSARFTEEDACHLLPMFFLDFLYNAPQECCIRITSVMQNVTNHSFHVVHPSVKLEAMNSGEPRLIDTLSLRDYFILAKRLLERQFYNHGKIFMVKLVAIKGNETYSKYANHLFDLYIKNIQSMFSVITITLRVSAIFFSEETRCELFSRRAIFELFPEAQENIGLIDYYRMLYNQVILKHNFDQSKLESLLNLEGDSFPLNIVCVYKGITRLYQ